MIAVAWRPAILPASHKISKGCMKGASMVLIAVAETDRARSPLLINVSAFEPPPVGVVPRMIIPTARADPVTPGNN